MSDEKNTGALPRVQNVKVSRDEKACEVEVKAEIPLEALARYREEALKEMQQGAKMDGFRPGKVPTERIVEVYGEAAILRRGAELAIQQVLPELLAAQSLLIIESPKVTTDAPEEGKPLSFSARAPLAPEVTLPDYKDIAKRHNAEKADISVSDEEHKETMKHLRRERARIEKVEKGAEPQKAAEEAKALAEHELPELDDEFVKGLGYENAEDFSNKLRENIKNEKELREVEKRRAALLDELVESSKVKYPAILKEYELDDMEARVKADIERMGMKFEQYLEQTKKTREELRKEWADAADKRAKVRLVLTEIARNEHLEADQARLEKELAHAKQHYPDAKDDLLRAHIAHALRNEQVIAFFEQQ